MLRQSKFIKEWKLIMNHNVKLVNSKIKAVKTLIIIHNNKDRVNSIHNQLMKETILLNRIHIKI